MPTDIHRNGGNEELVTQVYSDMESLFGGLVQPIDQVLGPTHFFVTRSGEVYEGKELVRKGTIDISDVRTQIRQFVEGQIGDVAPFSVTTESGESWSDWKMFI